MSRFPNSSQPGGSKSMPAGQSIGGTYSCQTCDEIVGNAVHVKATQEIYWKCSKDHISKISFRM